MKVKLDENLPASLAAALGGLGHDVDTVPSEGLAGSSDADVWEAAKGAGRLLLTQDMDFSDISRFLPGSHPGIVLLRLRDPGLGALRKRVLAMFSSEKVEEWHGAFVVATDRKVRVRK